MIVRAGGVIALIGCLAVASACSPTVHSHGYTPRAGELNDIAIGRDTRQSVQQRLGRPSTVSTFTDDEWYYISVTTETTAFFAPEVVEQRVVTVSFDDQGVVADVGRYGLEDGRVVDLVARTTPTSGRKLTLIQQIFANLGRFSTDQIAPVGSNPGLPGG